MPRRPNSRHDAGTSGRAEQGRWNAMQTGGQMIRVEAGGSAAAGSAPLAELLQCPPAAGNC